MPLPKLSPDEFHVLIFGPGTGELVMIRAPGAHWLVVDGCRAGGSAYALETLREYGERPRLIVLTHPHLDHAKGLADLIDDFTPSDAPDSWPKLGLLLPPDYQGAGDPDPKAALEGGETLQALNAIVTRWARNPLCKWDLVLGSKEILGQATVTVVSPSLKARKEVEKAAKGGKHYDRNIASSALVIDWEDQRVVLGSDLCEKPGKGWSVLVGAYPHVADHSVLKAPHHGSIAAYDAGLHKNPSGRSRRALLTPFASSNLPRFGDREGVEKLLKHFDELDLTALPRAYSHQGGPGTKMTRSALKQGGKSLRLSPPVSGFPDCYVICSMRKGAGAPTLTYGPGSVVVGR